MKDKVELCFITRFDSKKVMCYFFEFGDSRVFKRDPFFRNMKLYNGKNITFTTKERPGCVMIDCGERNVKKFIQLWNYYIKWSFKIK